MGQFLKIHDDAACACDMIKLQKNIFQILVSEPFSVLMMPLFVSWSSFEEVNGSIVA